MQRGEGHFAKLAFHLVVARLRVRVRIVLRPLQSTASVIAASASAASLGFVRRLQRCAQWASQQEGGDTGVAAAVGVVRYK